MMRRIDRRIALGLIGGGPVAAAAARATEPVSGGWIDGHCHSWSADRAAFPLAAGRSAGDVQPPAFPAESLLQREQARGVGRIVLIQHIENFGFDSRYLTDMARSKPGVFAVVGAIGERPTAPETAMRDRKSEGVKGFRVRGFMTRDWLNAPEVDRMWEVAAAENLVICPLLRDSPQMDDDALLHVAELARRHPDTTVCLDHMAHVVPGDTVQLRRLLDLARWPRVHVKISGLNKFDLPPYERVGPQVRTLLDVFGAQRLLWGSDLPVLEYERPNNFEATFAFVDRIPRLTDRERDSLLRDTASGLFFA